MNKEVIISCLKELSDKEFQEKAWTGQTPGVVASLIEAAERLYTDSGLGHALETNPIVFSESIDSRLRSLKDNLTPLVNEKGYLAEAASDPRMVGIRDLSGEILSDLILLGSKSS
jgi:hypothetical protein